MLHPGLPIKVQVLYEGKPFSGARVSFIPRGVEVAVHHLEPDQRGDGYDSTKYAATLTVFVPEVCPCCE